MKSWLCPKCNHEIVGDTSEEVYRKAEVHMNEHNISAMDRIRQMFAKKKQESDLEEMT